MKYEFKEGEEEEALQRKAREQLKLRLLADIEIDMVVCELMNSNPLEYISELKEIIDGIYNQIKKKLYL